MGVGGKIRKDPRNFAKDFGPYSEMRGYGGVTRPDTQLTAPGWLGRLGTSVG